MFTVKLTANGLKKTGENLTSLKIFHLIAEVLMTKITY